MANTYLTRTQTAGNNQKFTYSCWFKVGDLNSSETSPRLLHTELSSVLYMRLNLRLSDSCKLDWYFASGGTDYYLRTNRSFRDTSAWYHLVIVADSTQGSGSNRMKMYINGVQETSFAQSSYPPQNLNMAVNNNGTPMTISKSGLSDGYFTGLMSHINFTDGTAYDATAFGQYDANGVWTINTSPSVTYGTNGFFILKDGNSVTDQSGNSNNFTVGGGTLTKTEDNPSNNFATLNPLDNYHAGGTFSNGNNRYNSVSNKHDFAVSTLGMPSGSGKFYAEFKMAQNTDYNVVGISDHGYQGSNQELSEDNYSYAYYNDSGNSAVRANGSNVLTSMPNYGDNDIIGVAVDLENHKLYFSKNGTYINSGNPASGSTGTGAVSINNLNTTPNTNSRGQGVYFFAVGLWNTSNAGEYFANFGNGYFGTAAITTNSGNGYAGAEGASKFNYQPPSGYSALSTKGLNL